MRSHPADDLKHWARRTQVLLMCITVVGGAIVAPALHFGGGDDQIMPALISVVACGFAAIVAVLAVARFGAEPAHRAMACLAATFIRLIVSLTIAIGVSLILRPDRSALAAWFIAWYLLMMIVEVAAMVRLLNANPRGATV